jgi:hypothetical protein
MLNNKVECALNELTNALFSAYDVIAQVIENSDGRVFYFSKDFSDDAYAKPSIYVNESDGFMVASELRLVDTEYSDGYWINAVCYDDDGLGRTVLIDGNDAESIMEILRSMKLYV